MNDVKISVIIVNWNGMQHLAECLYSLTKQTQPDFEIILVDNGSTDGSLDFVKERFPEVKTVSLDKNSGFCTGNNIGLKHACGDYIALLNNDTRVDENWLQELIKAMEEDALIGICASCMVNYYQSDIIDAAGDNYDICGIGFKNGNGLRITDFQEQHNVFGASAGAALYRRSMIDDIGFFDEDFFAVGEDVDLSFRAKIAGYTCVYVPSAVVYHKMHQTVGDGSNFQLYLSRRNVEFTYFKNMPTSLLLLTLPLHLLYEFLSMIDALIRWKLGIFLKAKVDFLKDIISVYQKRRHVQKKNRIPILELYHSFSAGYLWQKVKATYIKD